MGYGGNSGDLGVRVMVMVMQEDGWAKKAECDVDHIKGCGGRRGLGVLGRGRDYAGEVGL